jgi:hypothetical protein
VRLSSDRAGSLVVRSGVRYGVEYFLDARPVSELCEAMAVHLVPGVSQALAASALVPPAAPGRDA